MTRWPAAERSRHGVEQPADGGGRRTGAALHQVDHDGGPLVDRLQPLGGSVGTDRPTQPRRGHPPRLADRRDTTGHHHRCQVTDAAKAGQVGDEELAAPERAVGAVPDAVEADRQHRLGAAVLDETRRGVGVVVLHSDRRQPELEGELRRQVLRMEVVGDDLGHDPVQPGKVVDRLEERPVRRQVLEVADVMAGDDVAALGDGDGALQLRTDGEHGGRRGVEGQRQRLRRVAARPTQQLDPAAGGTGDRVVAADVDRAVVGQQAGDHRAEAVDGVGVVVGDRFVAEVAARHHQRPADTVEQQVVQRAVGQHHAELRETGCDPVDHGCGG